MTACADMDSMRNMVSLLQYEHNIVLDLVKKGHPEPDTKVCTNLRLMQLMFIMTKKLFMELAIELAMEQSTVLV